MSSVHFTQEQINQAWFLVRDLATGVSDDTYWNAYQEQFVCLSCDGHAMTSASIQHTPGCRLTTARWLFAAVQDFGRTSEE